MGDANSEPAELDAAQIAEVVAGQADPDRLPGMKVKLDDVAARAGVSLATVSRVLGKRGAVAEETRARVLEAMDALGYSRSTLLHEAPRRLVAVSAPGNPEYWQVQVCTRVATALQEHGLLITRPPVETETTPLEVAVDAGAVALVTPTLTSLHTDIPCIRVDEQSAVDSDDVSGDIIAARLDLGGGMTTAFEHLQAIGHRRIGLICNDSGELAVQLIRRFRVEHPARNFGVRLDDWIAQVPKSFSGGSRAVLDLKDATCTAVIVQSALQLHGALHGLRNRHLQVPRDMSIVGFGDSPTMKFTGPPATVLGIDVEGLSQALVTATLSTLKISGDDLQSVPPVFRPRLLARASTTAARQ
ncbi:LacI family DNA-binding transcriptional regulator [Brevibacterium aurantiacum]|uniref:LacI family DNA-binding transcriptional regulator n=1 Tax=Brevibacterium aurantiacum TaxID=273384 RepID=UPI000F6458BC|nr:LacI family DNA-binding transcriptional regulator [Brevibacterium aurantiacum]AZL10445.1 LacI family transcriptional regulator [Brevibacterium aurantiacum]